MSEVCFSCDQRENMSQAHCRTVMDFSCEKEKKKKKKRKRKARLCEDTLSVRSQDLLPPHRLSIEEFSLSSMFNSPQMSNPHANISKSPVQKEVIHDFIKHLSFAAYFYAFQC